MDHRVLFEHRLALKLGMTVYQMRETMTEEEFNSWMAYDRMEPLHSTDMELAQIAMMVAAFMGQKDVKFEDFYIHKQPHVEKEPEDTKQQDNEELERYIMNAYHG